MQQHQSKKIIWKDASKVFVTRPVPFLSATRRPVPNHFSIDALQELCGYSNILKYNQFFIHGLLRKVVSLPLRQTSTLWCKLPYYQSCSQDRKFRDRDQGQDQQCQDQERDQDRHLQDQDQDRQCRDQDQVAVHNKMQITYKLLNMLSTTKDCNQTQKLFCTHTMFSCSFKNVH